MRRLSFLDSYRAIAITAVAGFHFFTLWCPPLRDADVYPYGTLLSEFPIFKFGFFGLNFFFMISGFVITLTLESSRSYADFIVKRAARLAPALIACTAIVYALQFTPFRMPGLDPRPIDLLPSLTTVEPKLFGLAGLKCAYVIGSVWTLFVEIRFYLLAGLAYFVLSRTHFVLGLLGFSLATMALALARGQLDGTLGMLLTSVMLVRSIGWFALGAYALRLYQGRRTPPEDGLALLTWAALVALYWVFPPPVAPAVLTPQLPSALITFALPLLFATSVLSGRVQRALDRRWLISIGTVSYSLYLLHEVVGVTLISKIPPSLPLLVQLGLVAAVYAGVIALAALVFIAIENPGRALIRRMALGRGRETSEGRRGAGRPLDHGDRLTASIPRPREHDRAEQPHDLASSR